MESGLVHLRAEVHKRRAEVKHFPADTSTSKQNHKPKSFGIATNEGINLKCIKNKKNDILEDKTEEILKLEKSKNVLEEKAALYDEIKNGTRVLEDDDLNQKYLIDFQEKIYKEVSNAAAGREREKNADHKSESGHCKDSSASKEWVEYVDSFGRTRMCERQHLVYVQQQADMKEGFANKQQEKWASIEHETSKKDKVHYQDVLFDEARAHGAGFMAFSRDEAMRRQQQQALREVGAEAAKIREAKESSRRRQKKTLEGRLAKVRQRKRLKRGLPCKDVGELRTPPSSEDEAQSTIDTGESNDVTNNVPPPASGESHVREWDLGKPGVGAIMTQEQWIESRRKVRQNEFAPPSAYRDIACLPNETSRGPNNRSIPLSQRCSPQYDHSQNGDETLSKDREKRNAFAPPASYDYYHSAEAGKGRRSLGNKVDIETAITKGISLLRNKHDNANT